MLLVDDDHGKIVKLYILLDDGMSANQYVERAVDERLVYLFSFFGASATGQKSHFDTDRLCPLCYGLIVLTGEDFCRGHEAGLCLIVDGYEHSHKGHHRLATAYVTLQKTIHLSAGAHIGANLFDDALLSISELEWKHLGVEPIEVLADCREYMPANATVATLGEAKNVELNEKQLFEFQTLLCFLQVVKRLGEMYVAKCIAKRHEAELSANALWYDVGDVIQRGLGIDTDK